MALRVTQSSSSSHKTLYHITRSAQPQTQSRVIAGDMHKPTHINAASDALPESCLIENVSHSRKKPRIILYRIGSEVRFRLISMRVTIFVEMALARCNTKN